MTGTPVDRFAARSYEFRIDGHLDPHWHRWFDDLKIRLESDGTTTLAGRVADQAALHGVLAKIRDAGMLLIWIRSVDPPDYPSPDW